MALAAPLRNKNEKSDPGADPGSPTGNPKHHQHIGVDMTIPHVATDGYPLTSIALGSTIMAVVTQPNGTPTVEQEPAPPPSEGPEIDDLVRLVSHCSDALAVVDGQQLYIAMPSGTWAPLRTIESPAGGAFHTLLQEAREEAIDETWWADPELVAAMRSDMRRTVHHARQVMAAAAMIIAAPSNWGIKTITSHDLDRTDRPVLPLSGGGAVDLTVDRSLSPLSLRPLLQTYAGTGVRYRPELLEPGRVPAAEQAVQHFGPDVLRRLALHALGPRKAADVVVYSAPNSGKTTLTTWFGAAFGPLSVTLEGERVFKGGDGGRFSSVLRYLSSGIRWLFVDEADKIPEISAGAANELTGDFLTVERKGVDARSERRTATVVFLGNGWPAIDSDSPGAAARFRWAIERQTGTLPQAVRDGIMTRDGVDFLVAWVVREAQALWASPEPERATVTPDSRRDAARMLQETADERVDTLKGTYSSGGPGDRVTVADIRKTLEGAGQSGIGDRDLGRIISKAFPSARPLKGPRGIRMRTHMVRVSGEDPGETVSGVSGE